MWGLPLSSLSCIIKVIIKLVSWQDNEEDYSLAKHLWRSHRNRGMKEAIFVAFGSKNWKLLATDWGYGSVVLVPFLCCLA